MADDAADDDMDGYGGILRAKLLGGAEIGAKRTQSACNALGALGVISLVGGTGLIAASRSACLRSAKAAQLQSRSAM